MTPADKRRRAKELADKLASRYGCIHDTRDMPDDLLTFAADCEAAAIERCEKVCRERATAWAKSVAEGSEQDAYERTVLGECADAIAKLREGK